MRKLAINRGKTTMMSKPEFLRWMKGKQLWSIGWYDAQRYDPRETFLPHDAIAFCARHKLGYDRGRPYYDNSKQYTSKGVHVYGLLHWKVTLRDGSYYVTRVDRRPT